MSLQYSSETRSPAWLRNIMSVFEDIEKILGPVKNKYVDYVLTLTHIVFVMN